MTTDEEINAMANKALKEFLKVFGFEAVNVKEKTAYRIQTDNFTATMAALSMCHDKLYRAILSSNIMVYPKSEQLMRVKDFRNFTVKYLDTTTNEFLELLVDNKVFILKEIDGGLNNDDG